MARIATVATDERRGTKLVDMSAIRWYEMSRALADLGHEVDIVHGRYKWRLRQPVEALGPNLREVPLGRVRWSDYDVVKTLFHRGFESLRRFGGGDHPFIISKLGSVVGASDLPGIYFYGEQRRNLFETQTRISEASRYVTLLSEPARALWRDCHGGGDELLLVPGACSADIPPRGPDPYPAGNDKRIVFAGNFYSGHHLSQSDAHETIAGKLNQLGERLSGSGMRVYVVGTGDADSLNPDFVGYLGSVDYAESWNYLHWAHLGLVVSAGAFMHNNESTKIYHYLRVGLPVVMESGFPNDHLVADTGHGVLVEPGDLDGLCDAVLASASRSWEADRAREHILSHHTWAARARVYDEVIRREFGSA